MRRLTARRDLARFFCFAAAASLAACGSDDGGDAKKKDPEPEPPSPEWAHYGYDPGQTRANIAESAITKSSVSGLVRKWEVPAQGITAVPQVVDGVVYWSDWDGVVHATNAADGSTVWESQVSSNIQASVFVHEDKVFVGDGSGYVYGLARDGGAVLWSNQIATDAGSTIYTSPLVAGGVAIFGTANSPNSQLQTFRGAVVGVDVNDGTEKWRQDVTKDGAQEYGVGVSVWSSPALDEERKAVYIGTGQSYAEPASPFSDAVVAVSYETGELIWGTQFTADDVFTFTLLMTDPAAILTKPDPDADVGATPNLFEVDGRAVVGAGDKGGSYYMMDRDSGEILWGKELTTGTPTGGVMTSAAVHDGVVYVASNDWGQYGVFPVPFTDEKNFCAVFALDAANNGAELWRRQLPSACIGGLAWAGGVVFIGVSDGTFYGLDDDDGETLWSDALGTNASGPAVSGGMVFMGYGWSFGPIYPASLDGGLVAYGLP